MVFKFFKWAIFSKQGWRCGMNQTRRIHLDPWQWAHLNCFTIPDMPSSIWCSLGYGHHLFVFHLFQTIVVAWFLTNDTFQTTSICHFCTLAKWQNSGLPTKYKHGHSQHLKSTSTSSPTLRQSFQDNKSPLTNLW